MINCETFRARLRPHTTNRELLTHMRTCDACVEHAVAVDPDNFFRVIGGDEMIPPGGVDAFTDEVMAQVRLRQTETSFAQRRVLAWPRRLAVAAAMAATMIGSLFVMNRQQPAAQLTARSAQHHAAPIASVPLTTKPIIETYQSQNATIIEVPAEGANVVMIFDDKLPADL
jgi:anti-sigma factor RsiW